MPKRYTSEATCFNCGKSLDRAVETDSDGKVLSEDGPARYSFSLYRGTPLDPNNTYCSLDCVEAHASTLAEK